MGRGFQVWKVHLKISPREEKASHGLIFGGEEISILHSAHSEILYLRNLIVSFLNRELFGLRNIYTLNLKTSGLKKMSYVCRLI
jgi:hypothetical protein